MGVPFPFGDFGLMDNDGFVDFGLMDFGLNYGLMDFGLMDFGLMDYGLMDFGFVDFCLMDFGLMDFQPQRQKVAEIIFNQAICQQIEHLPNKVELEPKWI